MKEAADNAPDAEIEKYYKENTAAFEQTELHRIFVPKGKRGEAKEGKQEAAKPTDKENVDDDSLTLKAGEISQLIADPSGYYIYKVVSKNTKPLDQARSDIRAILVQNRFNDAMHKVEQSAKTELNQAYSSPMTRGGGGKDNRPGATALGPRRVMPPSPGGNPTSGCELGIRGSQKLKNICVH